MYIYFSLFIVHSSFFNFHFSFFHSHFHFLVLDIIHVTSIMYILYIELFKYFDHEPIVCRYISHNSIQMYIDPKLQDSNPLLCRDAT